MKSHYPRHGMQRYDNTHGNTNRNLYDINLTNFSEPSGIQDNPRGHSEASDNTRECPVARRALWSAPRPTSLQQQELLPEVHQNDKLLVSLWRTLGDEKNHLWGVSNLVSSNSNTCYLHQGVSSFLVPGVPLTCIQQRDVWNHSNFWSLNPEASLILFLYLCKNQASRIPVAFFTGVHSLTL